MLDATAQSPHDYLMEGPREAARLECKTRPEESEKQLRLVGLRPGMRVLDAGCGTGAVSRVMARLVGAEGSVRGVDCCAERIEIARGLADAECCDNLTFQQVDLTKPPITEGFFDLAWCRFVFEYLDRPEAVLRNLIRSVRVGGKIVVGDLDGNGQFHHPTSEQIERGMALMLNALSGRFDPYAGRKLYHMFRIAQLTSIRVHMLPYHLYAGNVPPEEVANWTAKFDTLKGIGATAFGGEQRYARWVNEFLRHLVDPDVFTYSVLFLVEGERPA